MSAPELRERLDYFYSIVLSTLESATLRAGQVTDDLERLRALTSAKIRAMRIYRAILFQTEPRDGFADAWTVTVQARVFFESDEAKAEFGPATPILEEAFHRLERQIETIASSFLPLTRITEVSEALETYAREQPIRSVRSFSPPDTRNRPSTGPVAWILRLPLAPFRAMTGVDRTAHAVHELTLTADAFSQMISSLPVEISWEGELLLLQSRREIAALVEQNLARVDTLGRGLVDHLAWRLTQVLALWFVLALVLRAVARRGAPVSSRRPD